MGSPKHLKDNWQHNGTGDWEYRGYDDDEVRIDFEDVGFDEDGHPCLTEVSFTRLDPAITTQELEDFAHTDLAGAGLSIRHSYWAPQGDMYVALVHAPQMDGSLV